MTISCQIRMIFPGLACLLFLSGCQQATPPAPSSGAAAPPAATVQLATAELKLVERRGQLMQQAVRPPLSHQQEMLVQLN